MRQRKPLDATERGKRIKAIRLHLGPVLGDNVSQVRFGELVAEAAGLGSPFAGSTVKRWEEGAEPGLVAGAVIAHLGGVSVDALVFADVPAPGERPPLSGGPDGLLVTGPSPYALAREKERKRSEEG